MAEVQSALSDPGQAFNTFTWNNMLSRYQNVPNLRLLMQDFAESVLLPQMQKAGLASEGLSPEQVWDTFMDPSKNETLRASLGPITNLFREKVARHRANVEQDPSLQARLDEALLNDGEDLTAARQAYNDWTEAVRQTGERKQSMKGQTDALSRYNRMAQNPDVAAFMAYRARQMDPTLPSAKDGKDPVIAALQTGAYDAKVHGPVLDALKESEKSLPLQRQYGQYQRAIRMKAFRQKDPLVIQPGQGLFYIGKNDGRVHWYDPAASNATGMYMGQAAYERARQLHGGAGQQMDLAKRYFAEGHGGTQALQYVNTDGQLKPEVQQGFVKWQDTLQNAARTAGKVNIHAMDRIRQNQFADREDIVRTFLPGSSLGKPKTEQVASVPAPSPRAPSGAAQTGGHGQPSISSAQAKMSPTAGRSPLQVSRAYQDLMRAQTGTAGAEEQFLPPIREQKSPVQVSRAYLDLMRTFNTPRDT